MHQTRHDSSHPKTINSRWTREQKIGVWTLVVAILTVAVTFTVPELRRFVGLEKSTFAPTGAPASKAQAQRTEPNPIVFTSLAHEGKPAVLQRSNTKVKGSNNNAGNGNVVGNNNQVSQPLPSINAPNGIAIGGGTVNNPTVINNGPPPPPPLELSWTVRDVVPSMRTDFSYQKEITVTPNVMYSPVSLGVTCDSEIGMISFNFKTGGAFTSAAEGSDKNDRRIGYVSFETPAVRPDKPLLIYVFSSKPLSVLSVRQAKIEGLN
jgi:hypothetical protein